MGACGAALIIPEARWHALDGLCYAVNYVPEWQRATAIAPTPRIRAEVPGAYVVDFSTELGRVTLAELGTEGIAPEGEIGNKIEQMTELMRRYPNEKAIYAHLGRYYAGLLRLPVTDKEKNDPSVRKGWDELRRLMIAGTRKEPGNPFFFQMLAAAHLGLGNKRAAREMWEAASHMGKWKDYSEFEVFDQWQLLEAAYGKHGPRQLFPSIAMLRLPHLALIEETAIVFLKPESGHREADRSIRLATLSNGSLIRRDALQVVAGLVGASIVERAMQPPGVALETITPKAIETGRSRFLAQFAGQPTLRDRLSAEINANDGYQYTIPSSSAIEFSGTLNSPGRPGTWSNWLFRSIALAAITDGVFGLMARFLLGYLFCHLVLWVYSRWSLYLPERLRAMLALGAGLVVGLLAFLASDLWPIGVLFALLIGGLAYSASATDIANRGPAAGTDFIVWTWRHTLGAVLVIVVCLAATLYGFIFRYAAYPDVHQLLTGMAPPVPVLETKGWGLVAWTVTALPLATAIAWAAISKSPLIPAAAQGLSRICLIGAGMSLALFFLTVPITVHYDRADEARLRQIAQNEPNYYRNTETRYHETGPSGP